MKTLAPHFSDKAKVALGDLSSFLRSVDGVEEIIAGCALGLVFTDDAVADAQLQKAGAGIAQALNKGAPNLSSSLVNGLTIAFREMVAARVNEYRSREGRA